MILCNVRAAYWTTQCNTASTGALCSCELAQLNVPTPVFWTLLWSWCLNSNYCPKERNFKFKVPKNALTKHAAHRLGICEQLNIASSQRPILNCWHTFCNLILSTWSLCSLLAVSILMNVGIGLIVLLHVWFQISDQRPSILTGFSWFSSVVPGWYLELCHNGFFAH
jgi:hypothetical protein